MLPNLPKDSDNNNGFGVGDNVASLSPETFYPSDEELYIFQLFHLVLLKYKYICVFFLKSFWNEFEFVLTIFNRYLCQT